MEELETIKNELIEKSVVVKKNEPVISSQMIAKIFDKEHYNVLRDIENLIENFSALKIEAAKVREYFIETTSKDKQNKSRKSYNLTEKGFNLLVMGFTGEKAFQYKVYLVNQFESMKKFIKEITELAMDYKPLTDAVYEYNNRLGKEDNFYHYSNEADMLNRIVVGMSATKYREMNNLEKEEPIRRHFTEAERKLLKELQKYDAILLNMDITFEERKQQLNDYKERISLKILAS